MSSDSTKPESKGNDQGSSGPVPIRRPSPKSKGPKSNQRSIDGFLHPKPANPEMNFFLDTNDLKWATMDAMLVSSPPDSAEEEDKLIVMFQRFVSMGFEISKKKTEINGPVSSIPFLGTLSTCFEVRLETEVLFVVNYTLVLGKPKELRYLKALSRYQPELKTSWEYLRTRLTFVERLCSLNALTTSDLKLWFALRDVRKRVLRANGFHDITDTGLPSLPKDLTTTPAFTKALEFDLTVDIIASHMQRFEGVTSRELVTYMREAKERIKSLSVTKPNKRVQRREEEHIDWSEEEPEIEHSFHDEDGSNVARYDRYENDD